MRALFATAELVPLAKVGGLAEASSGLVRGLQELGVDVTVVVPDYTGARLEGEQRLTLEAPRWAKPASARLGELPGMGPLALVDVPGTARPHPYLDDEGRGWADNDRRFLAFSAATAALVEHIRPDVLHLNDWHTGAALAFLNRPPPSVLTIHNLAYQGVAPGAWLSRLPRRPEAYEWYGSINPLAGGIVLANRVVAVSPNYAREIVRPESGFGLDRVLAAKGGHLIGIRNGIDTTVWGPATDRLLDTHFDADLTGKRIARKALLTELGWKEGREPLVGMVTRLTDQKGVDLALEAARYLPGLPARMVLLGAGERGLARQARLLAEAMPERLAFREGYDEPLAHRIFAGSDLYLMPSRFEPCGLAQMQAMAYGALPVVTDVGGLRDTVLDADREPVRGTGFVAPEVTAAAVVDALHRAARAWRATKRRRMIQERGMAADWSWAVPAEEYQDLYRELLGR
ncbi:MAG: glycogen synthase [Acidimicrobiia bacterium]